MIQTIPTTKAVAVALITAHLEQRTDEISGISLTD
jgi:hypothetical protein